MIKIENIQEEKAGGTGSGKHRRGTFPAGRETFPAGRETLPASREMEGEIFINQIRQNEY
jgi:hypothetical protein